MNWIRRIMNKLFIGNSVKGNVGGSIEANSIEGNVQGRHTGSINV